jgi:hypothetical protein
MKLTARLFAKIYRVFSRDPLPFLAFRLRCDGSDMTWQVTDGVLTTSPVGGTAAPLTIDLSAYTLWGLVTYLVDQPGYSVPYGNYQASKNLSALVLIEASGEMLASNGDHVYAYTSVNWARLEAWAEQLQIAANQIPLMPAEMSTTTADGSWLDFIGNVYDVPRASGEADAQYGPRIIIETLRPKSNNIAIAEAIKAYTGQAAQVNDVVQYNGFTPLYNSGINFDGTHEYNATGTVEYNLFDVTTGYDLLQTQDITNLTAIVTSIINKMRSAGCFLRNLIIAPFSALEDQASVASDAESTLALTCTYTYGGTYNYDGTPIYAGGLVLTGALDGQLD